MLQASSLFDYHLHGLPPLLLPGQSLLDHLGWSSTHMARPTEGERWAFIADWLDPHSGVQWTYQLFAYITPEVAVDVEMFDIKNRRHFLKRVRCNTVEPAQLYVGSTVTVFARQLHLISYGDEATRRAVEARCQRTLALVLPDAVHHTGKIVNAIYTSGFSIINLRMCQLSPDEARLFVAAQNSNSDPYGMVELLASGRVVAIELMAASGVRKWLDMLGPADVTVARQQAPDSIRSLFGTDAVRKAAHGSDSPASAVQEIEYFFGGSSSSNTLGKSSLGSSSHGSTVLGSSWQPGSVSTSRSAACRAASSSSGCVVAPAHVRSCCRCCGTALGVILPHAAKDGVAGLMLDEIQAAFQVTGLQLFNLSKQAAAEFLEVYKGVVPPGQFSAMVDELASGPCIAVEVAAQGGQEPVQAFRQLVGPHDPELARLLRPNTLRARFGVSRVRNSIHCTDLVEDGPLEASYFFAVLQQPTLAH